MAISKNEISIFFKEYSDAYSLHDIEKLSDMFAYPGHVVSNPHHIVLVPIDNRGTWKTRLSELLLMYDKIGFRKAIVQDVSCRILSKNIAQVEIIWELQNKENNVLFDFNTNYTIVMCEGMLKIAQAISPNELINYKKYLTKLKINSNPNTSGR